MQKMLLLSYYFTSSLFINVVIILQNLEIASRSTYSDRNLIVHSYFTKTDLSIPAEIAIIIQELFFCTSLQEWCVVGRSTRVSQRNDYLFLFYIKRFSIIGPRGFQFDLEMNYNKYCIYYIIGEDYWRP